LNSNNPYAGRSLRQKWLVFALTTAALLGAMDRQVMQLLLHPIKVDLGLTDTQVSLLYGMAFSLANILFLLPAGYLADRINRRNLLVAGIAVWSGMTMLCGAATSYWAMFFARSGVGFGESVIQPTGSSMLRSAIPLERRGRAFATYAMAILLGTALALLLGGRLVHLLEAGAFDWMPIVRDVKPWQGVLMLLGLAGAPVLLLILSLHEPSRDLQGSVDGTSYRETLRYLNRHRRVFVPLLLFNTFAGMMAFGFAAWIAPFLMRVWHLTIPEIGAKAGLMMLLLPPIGLVVVGFLIDYLTKRHGKYGPLYIAAPVLLLRMALMTSAPLVPDLTIFWLLLGFEFLISGALFPILNSVIASIAPAQLLGKITGIQYILYGIFGGAIAATVIAGVSDTFFTGATAIAKALSICSFAYGLVSLVGLVIALRNMKRLGGDAVYD